jgi:hypothetical protein
MFIIMYMLSFIYVETVCQLLLGYEHIVTTTVARYGQPYLASTIGCLYVAVHAVIIGTCHDIQLLE